MGLLLAFAPFIGFAVVDRAWDTVSGLMAGTLLAGALLVRDLLKDDFTPKLLDIGSFMLFAGLAMYGLAEHPDWSIIDVRLRVDAGLLGITALSLLMGRPFTLQYARERVPPELWTQPRFLRTNYIISGAWALAFAVMVAVDLAMRQHPDAFMHLGMLATAIALVSAMKFTSWYPGRVAPPTA